MPPGVALADSDMTLEYLGSWGQERPGCFQQSPVGLSLYLAGAHPKFP